MDLKSFSKKQIILLVTLLLIVIAIPITLYLSQKTQIFKPRAQESVETNQETLEDLTNQLLQAASKEQPQNQADSIRSQSVQRDKPANLLEIARKRKTKALEEIEKDPQKFLQNLIPEEIRDQLPSEVQNPVEKNTQVTGELSVTHFDDFDNSKSKTYYQLKADNLSYNIHFAGDPVSVNTYGQYKVRGVGLDQEIVLPDANGTNVGKIDNKQQVSWGSTQINLMVILVRYRDQGVFYLPDQGAFNVSKDSIEQNLINNSRSLATYLRESTYNQVSLQSVDVFDWLTIPENYPGNCPARDIMTKGFEAAAQNGIEKNKYNMWAFVFPRDSTCVFQDMVFDGFVVSSIPNTLFLNQNDSAHAFEHEIGHLLSLSHASSIDSKDNFEEYGDTYDVMGSGFGQYNVFHKLMGGWISNNDIETVTQSGTYTISPLEENSGIRALKIHRFESGDDYFVEYRQPIGIIDGLLKPEASGVLISRVPRTTYTGTATKLVKNSGIPPLSYGESFHDPTEDITIRQLSPDSSSARLEVLLGDTSSGNTCKLSVPPSVQFDCSNKKKCFNDFQINPGKCTVVPKINPDGTHFHCDYDNFKEECKDLGTGWVGTSGCGSRNDPANQVIRRFCNGLMQLYDCWYIDYRDEGTQCRWTHIYTKPRTFLNNRTPLVCFTVSSCSTSSTPPNIDALLGRDDYEAVSGSIEQTCSQNDRTACPDLPMYCEGDETWQATGGYCNNNQHCIYGYSPIRGNPLNCPVSQPNQSPSPSPVPSTPTPTSTPQKTITSILINNQPVDISNPEVTVTLPGLQLGIPGLSYIPVQIYYSDGTTKPLLFNFNYLNYSSSTGSLPTPTPRTGSIPFCALKVNCTGGVNCKGSLPSDPAIIVVGGSGTFEVTQIPSSATRAQWSGIFRGVSINPPAQIPNFMKGSDPQNPNQGFDPQTGIWKAYYPNYGADAVGEYQFVFTALDGNDDPVCSSISPVYISVRGSGGYTYPTPSTTGQPATCGTAGLVCCTGQVCTDGSTCINSYCGSAATHPPCGGTYQVCCANNPQCGTNLSCVNGYCNPIVNSPNCGGNYLACCTTSPQCSGTGFSCINGTCNPAPTPTPCGGSSQVCCSSTPRCSGSRSCISGYCSQ